MNSCDFEYKERFLFCNWLFLQIKLIKLTRIHAFSSARISSFKLIGNSEYKNILTQIRFLETCKNCTQMFLNYGGFNSDQDLHPFIYF